VPILRALALPFTDHPDFLDEWNPWPNNMNCRGRRPWPAAPHGCLSASGELEEQERDERLPAVPLSHPACGPG